MAAGPDVRPGGRIKEEDEVRFAVVTGWHRQVMTTLDASSARRRADGGPA
ncbi:hypothetical protein [Streptomyces europaeiscabiei]